MCVCVFANIWFIWSVFLPISLYFPPSCYCILCPLNNSTVFLKQPDFIFIPRQKKNPQKKKPDDINATLLMPTVIKQQAKKVTENAKYCISELCRQKDYSRVSVSQSKVQHVWPWWAIGCEFHFGLVVLLLQLPLPRRPLLFFSLLFYTVLSDTPVVNECSSWVLLIWHGLILLSTVLVYYKQAMSD